MGSGSSKQSKTEAQRGNVSNNVTGASKSSETPLLGSSKPPKAPWAEKDGSNVGTRESDKGSVKNSVKGNAVERRGSGDNHVKANGTSGRPVDSEQNIKASQSDTNNARPTSARRAKR